DVTGAPVANDDQATAGVVYQNVVETVALAPEFNFATGAAVLLPTTGSGSDTFTIAPNTTSDVTVVASSGGVLSLLPSFTVTVRNGSGDVVHTVTQTALADVLGLGSGISVTVEDLTEGTYTLEVSATNPLLGLGFTTTVQLAQEITHLDQYEVAGTTNATGDLLDNDTLGSAFIELQVNDGTGFVDVGDAGLTINGTYGTLTVTETGEYVYTPRADLPHSASDLVDSFTYQLVSPDGRTETAALEVTVDVSGAGTTGIAPFAASTFSLATADVVELGSYAAEPVETVNADKAVLASLAYDMFEGQGDLENVLRGYLDEPNESTIGAESDNSIPNITEMDTVQIEAQDPLSYLTMPDDPEKDSINSAHII
ncbi:BapA/Bap/LapF family large adhesin, partial [Sphingomonas sp. DT-204]|uniref:BapA/Bap/LapF family large adhesin n=1 Tax=Sphingomonas sp. DT-204 TaxID=3396166 RepID=UPI003F1DF92A